MTSKYRTEGRCDIFSDVHTVRVPTLLVAKKFQNPRIILPGPCRKSILFKYSDKLQLGGLESTVSSPSMVWGRSPAAKAFWNSCSPENVQLELFSSAETCLFEAKNCHPHRCLENSRTFQALEIFH